MSTGLMVALDMDDAEDAVALAGELAGMVSAFKVGSQLYARCGPDVIDRIRDAGGEVFLDLKFHDIPNTVGKSVEGVVGRGVAFLTVHASGGSEMIRAAAQAAGGARVLAVTVLTSLEQKDADNIGFSDPLEQQVRRLARLARDAGAHGIVCSPLEVSDLRQSLDDACILVTPGIRPAGSSRDDQARIATPAQAAGSGADYIVVGRPIVNAVDRRAVVEGILIDLAR